MMKTIQTAKNLIPVGQFKSHLKEHLQRLVETDEVILITQNGKGTGVLMSPRMYDDFYSQAFRASVEQGLADLDAGRFMTQEEGQRRMRATLDARWPQATKSVRKPSTKAAKVTRRKKPAR